MSNDSTTAGLLTPNATPAPLADDDLANFLQHLVVGLTGIAGPLVRPRWQPQPPNLPAQSVSWVALGVRNRTAQTFAYEAHDPAGDGKDYIQRHEELEILCSFYGPNADRNAALFRDGLSVEQNRTYLVSAEMGLISVGSAISVPELVNNLWYMRVDMPFFIRRAVTRTYKILNLLSSSGVIITDIPPRTVPFEVTNS